MNLAELIRRYRTDANDKVVPYFTSDEDVTAWLNDAVVEAAIRGRLIHESDNSAMCRIAVKADKSVYPLHAAMYELSHVAFKLDSQAKRCKVLLVSTEWLDAGVPEWRDRAGVPTFAVQSDRSLRLVPRPNVAGELLMEGYRLPAAAMESGDDEPEINESHHRHLIHWALHRGFSVPDSEFFDPERAARSEAAFTDYFGLRPDSDLRRETREDVPQHVTAFLGIGVRLAKYKLKLEQGATLRKPFTWKAAGVEVDLTGYSARMQIRPAVDSDEVIAELTTENGGIVIEALPGTFTLFLSDAATSAFTFTTAVYDLEFIAPNDDVIRLLEGQVTLSPEVTRDV